MTLRNQNTTPAQYPFIVVSERGHGDRGIKQVTDHEDKHKRAEKQRSPALRASPMAFLEMDVGHSDCSAAVWQRDK